jgi:hypothetical protein
MRALSWRQASRCESARGGKCRCRCGGLLHGSKRIEQPEREFFEALPAEDPHHLPDAEERKQRRNSARKQARLQRELPLFPQHYGED